MMDMEFFSELFWVLPGTMTKIFTKGKLLPRMLSEMSKIWYHMADYYSHYSLVYERMCFPFYQ